MEALLAESATVAGAAGAGAGAGAAAGQSRGPRVLVLGGGVIGLTSAFVLQTHGYQVDVVSDTFPTDMHTGAAAGSGASSGASSGTSASASASGPVPPSAKANFCSDKAGAHWFSFATADPIDAAQRQWDIVTYHALMALVHTAPDAAVTAVSSTQLFLDPTPNDGVQWWAPYVRDYQSVSPQRLKALSHGDAKWACGITFTAAMMHASRYLSWLSRAVQSLGVRLVKVDTPIRCLLTLLRAIDAAAAGPHRYAAVVNCLALGAGSAFVPRPVAGSGVTERAQALYGAPSGGGVLGLSDPDVYPTRGQTVLVYAPHLTDGIWRCPGRTGTAEHSTYILPKGDGTVVLGGTYQHYDANLVPTREDAVDIARRCERLLPADLKGVAAAVEKSFDSTVRSVHPSEGRIAQAVYCIDHRNTTAANARNAAAPRDLQVLRHSVGLRPSRRGGVRLEVQRVDSCSALVVHHYGHGGYGFQSSWGSAQAMLQLLSTALPAAASTACHCHRHHSAAFQASPRTAGAAAVAAGRALEQLRDRLPTPWLSAVHCVLSGCVAATSGPALRALTAASPASAAGAPASAKPQSKL